MSDFRINITDTHRLFSVWDALSLYVEKGTHQQLWQHPAFQAAYDFSKQIQQSAYHLKKQLPKQYIESIRFSQTPSTWVLSVNDPTVAKQLRQFFQQHATDISEALGNLPHVQVRHIQQNWQRTGTILSTASRTFNGQQASAQSLPTLLQSQLSTHDCEHIRCRYHSSVWHLNVANSLLGKRLSLLLDDIALNLAHNIGYAPALKVTVQPNNWINSGLLLTDITFTTVKNPTPSEADQIIADFLSAPNNH